MATDSEQGGTLTFDVNAQELPRDVMYLHEVAAKGEFEGEAFEVDAKLPLDGIVLCFRGRRWEVPLRAIVGPLLGAAIAADSSAAEGARRCRT